MKKLLITLGVLIGILLIVVLWFFNNDRKDPYQQVTWGKFSGECPAEDTVHNDFGKDFVACDHSVAESEIPTFKEIAFNFTNEFDASVSLPMMASAMIDIDNDGVDEVFVGGGVEQQDALFKYNENGFSNISGAVNLPNKPKGTTFGVTSFDLDGNGFNDLILTGDYGVYWYKNNEGQFTSSKINVELDEKSSPATTTIGDYNNDGFADIFLSTYIPLEEMEGQSIFKDFHYGASSRLLKNNGDNTFTDVTQKAGLAYQHNTFQAILVDIDLDGFLDLVIAYDTGEVRTYKNEGGEKFILMKNPMTGKYGYPMGIAIGDYNNDGKIDFFFSNTGSSVPPFMARGDLANEDLYVGEWILFKNNGDFNFTDVAKETKVADFEFSWGTIFEDFNLDGRQDLVVAENYVDFPPHKLFKLPCRFLVQRKDGTFAAVEEQAGVVNKYYGITPLTSDFNKDGYPDLIYINLNGPVKAYINDGGNHNYISVRLPETSLYAGATVTVTLNDGTILSDVYAIGEGFCSDQTATLTFGLGKLESVASISVLLPNKRGELTVENPAINQVHLLQQDETK